MKFAVKRLEIVYEPMNWTEFINWNLNNLHHVIENETVVFYDRIFVDHLFYKLETTPKRTVANYLSWRIVLMTSKFLSEELRERYNQFEATELGVHKINPRDQQCAKQTMKSCVKSFNFFHRTQARNEFHTN